MKQPAFELQHVTRRFHRRTALDGTTLSQEAGKILGLVGLPGAGKTTLLHLIAGLDKPTTGRVHVLGGNPLASGTRTRIGYAPDPQLLDPSMTTQETLVQFSRLKGFPKKASQRICEQILGELNLDGESVRSVAHLSASSRQLLCVGVALIGNPELLLLDGTLDNLEQADESLLQLILRRKAVRGLAIVLTGECWGILGDRCDDIALLHRGCLLGKATPEEIRTSVRGLLFKYAIRGSPPVSLDLEGIEAQFTGSATEILADRDVSEQLDEHFGADAVKEVEPSFEEACQWILRNPNKISARSKMWGHDNPVIPRD